MVALRSSLIASLIAGALAAPEELVKRATTTCPSGQALRSVAASSATQTTANGAGFLLYADGFDIGNGAQYPDSTNLINMAYGTASVQACMAACVTYNQAASVKCTTITYVTQYSGCFMYAVAPTCGWTRSYDVYTAILAGTNDIPAQAAVASTSSTSSSSKAATVASSSIAPTTSSTSSSSTKISSTSSSSIPTTSLTSSTAAVFSSSSAKVATTSSSAVPTTSSTSSSAYSSSSVAPVYSSSAAISSSALPTTSSKFSSSAITSSSVVSSSSAFAAALPALGSSSVVASSSAKVSSSAAPTFSSSSAPVSVSSSSSSSSAWSMPSGWAVSSIAVSSSSAGFSSSAVVSSSSAISSSSSASQSSSVVSSSAAISSGSASRSSSCPPPTVWVTVPAASSTAAAGAGLAGVAVSPLSSAAAGVVGGVAAASSSVAAAVVVPTSAAAAAVVPAVASSAVAGNVVQAVATAASAATSAVVGAQDGGIAASVVSSAASAATSAAALTCDLLPSWVWTEWCQSSQTIINNIVSNNLRPAQVQKGFLIPLYIYPSWWTTPGAWDWVITAATSYPSLAFTVIVNPSSGPVPNPNSDYVHEMARLQALSNIKILGYVDTAYGSKAASAVASDVSTYASWPAIDATLQLDGIFFDNQASSSSYLSQYQGYATQVRTNAAFTGGIVGFAPGTVCDAAYFALADFVVIYEQSTSIVKANIFGWYNSLLTSLSTTQLSKTAWAIYNADASTTAVVENLQAAFNSQYLYVSNGGAGFTSAIGAGTLNTILDLITNPLALVAGV